MVDSNTVDPNCCVLNSILPAARTVAILFGFERGPWREPYVETKSSSNLYAIYNRVLPNNFARIDVIFLNGKPVGSLLFVEIANGIYHMVGMFINDEHRGKRMEYLADGKTTKCSIAYFFLHHVMNDLVGKGFTVTLEVMNYNKAAFKLYERWETRNKSSKVKLKFSLLSKTEIEHYGTLRKKPIKGWHDIDRGDNQMGVQWSHIPNYNGETRYSISRVYCCEADNSILSTTKLSYLKNKIKLIISAVKYGRPVSLLLNRLSSKLVSQQ